MAQVNRATDIQVPESSSGDAGTTGEIQVIEINPDAMYKLPDADEPIDGKTLHSRQMMQADYTKKTQSLSEREKSYQEQLAQREQEIEKLNNQVLSKQLDAKFQQTTQASGQPTTEVTDGTENNYDWLYQQDAAPTTPTQQGINSTPMNNLTLEQLAEMLSQHPKFAQPQTEQIASDIQKLFQQQQEANRREREVLERNLEIEGEYKKQFGQKGVDLFYAQLQAQSDGDIQRLFELQGDYNKLVAEKAIVDHEVATKKAQEEAVEQARSGPIVFEPIEGESKPAERNRRKREVIKKAQASLGALRQ
jgi:hypothetical protein